MPEVFFSYTSAREDWSKLIVSDLASRFQGECGWDVHDWKKYPIPGGAHLYDALKRRMDASEIFVALIHDDYFDHAKVAEWEFGNWAKECGNRKIIIPIVLSQTAKHSWNQVRKMHTEFGKGVDIENVVHLDLSQYLERDPPTSLGENVLPGSLSDQLQSIVTYVRETHALAKEQRPRQEEPPDKGQVLFVLGGVSDPVAEELDGYDAMVQGLRDKLAPLKVEVEDIGDKWGLLAFFGKDKQDILRRNAGKKKHVLLLSDDPTLKAVFGDAPDLGGVNAIDQSLIGLLQAEDDMELVAGQRFIWFRDGAVPEISPEFPCRPVEGADPGQAIHDMLGAKPQLQARFEVMQDLYDSFTQWYPRETRRRLNSENGEKIIPPEASQPFKEFEDLEKTLKEHPADTPLVLTILDKDLPTTSLGNPSKMRVYIMRRFNEFDRCIRKADGCKDRKVFGVLVQNIYEKALFEAGSVQGKSIDWLVLPVLRENGDEDKKYFDPDYLKKVQGHFWSFREMATG